MTRKELLDEEPAMSDHLDNLKYEEREYTSKKHKTNKTKRSGYTHYSHQSKKRFRVRAGRDRRGKGKR